MKNLAFLAMAASMMCVACSNDDSPVAKTDGDSLIKIDPVITRATDVDFEAGDRIGLTVLSEGVSYLANQPLNYSAVGQVFEAEGILWYEDTNASATLSAYYPYSEAGVPTSFSVQADQRAGGYTASDLMLSSKESVQPATTAVSMAFTHKLSKLMLTVTNDSGADIQNVVLKNAYGTASVDLDAQSVAVDESAGRTNVSACELTANALYKAILVPQSVALKVEVTTTDGQTRSLSLPATELSSGKVYKLLLRVLPGELQVSLTGEIDDWGDGGMLGGGGSTEFEDHESELYFTYDNVRYDYMKVGNTYWMTKNLRYLPSGVKPSADATADAQVWFPYSSTGSVTTALQDDVSIAQLGYLYSYDLVFGEEVTPENAESFEGAQGICPRGWHVPTQADCIGLAGKTNKNAAGVDLTDTTVPYYDTTYDGAIVAALNEAGFNFAFAGTRMKATLTATASYSKNVYDGHLSVNYLMGSTLYKPTYSTASVLTNVQFFGLMTTYTAKYADGRLMTSYLGYKSGYALRCVRTATAE